MSFGLKIFIFNKSIVKNANMKSSENSYEAQRVEY